jgi:hypothetical protein
LQLQVLGHKLTTLKLETVLSAFVPLSVIGRQCQNLSELQGPSLVHLFFIPNTFQIQPFHTGLAMRADMAFCFMPRA